MKQTIFMVLVTLLGTLGPFAVEPFVGLAVYYLFAVLRPQYMWEWTLPTVGWSGYVAYSTLAATAWWLLNGAQAGTGPVDVTAPKEAASAPPRRFSFAHKAFIAFGAWVCLTYFTALNQEVAWQWFVEYLKLFLMFGVAALIITRVEQVWWIYRLATIALIYIAYEMNYLYVMNGRLDIYHRGYGGLDNNGAGLMLAMAVPLAVHAWEGTRRLWRWGYLAGIPLLLHAVLMSYSRGAMLSLIVATPFLFARSGRKKQFTLVLIVVAAMIPSLAGREIRQRFFSAENYDTDASANARFDSWSAAIRIANDYPVFGVGIRNANLLSYRYGADVEGRTIHSQYFQTLADAGYPGLGLYLLAFGSTWMAMRRARKLLKPRTDDESVLARSMMSGAESSMVVFCFGAIFLSLEVFELPYVVALIGAQLAWLARPQPVKASVARTMRDPVPALHRAS